MSEKWVHFETEPVFANTTHKNTWYSHASSHKTKRDPILKQALSC